MQNILRASLVTYVRSHNHLVGQFLLTEVQMDLTDLAVS